MSFDNSLNNILSNIRNLHQIGEKIATEQAQPTKQLNYNLTEAMVDSILAQHNIAANVFAVEVTTAVEKTLLRKLD